MQKQIPQDTKFTDISDAETPLDVEGEDVTALGIDLDGQINSITQEFGGDPRDEVYKLTVHQVLKDKGKYAWLFSCVPTELPILDRLRDEYGGGEFEVRVFKNGRLNRRFFQTIVPPKKPIIIPSPDNTAMFMQGFERLGDLITKQQVAVAPAQAFDPAQMMTSMMAMMLQMKQFLAPASVPNNANNTIDMVLKGVELAKDIGGSGETTMMDVFRDLFKSPLITEAIKSAQNPVALPADLSGIDPNTGQPIPLPMPEMEHVPSEKPTVPGGVKMNMQDLMIKQYVNLLVHKAAQNADPGLYADFIIDNVSPEKIKEFLTNENAMQKLAEVNPTALDHVEWFTELSAIIMDSLTSPPTAPDNEANVGPDAATDNVDADTIGDGGSEGNVEHDAAVNQGGQENPPS